MIKNYLKVAFRSIFRNKLTAFINIAGLAIAMASAMMIYFFITDELSYDKYHTKIDRTYRVTREWFNREGVSTLHLSSVAPPFGPLIKNDFGEVEVMARTLNYTLVMAIEENGERVHMNTETEVFMAEPDLFKIFDIDMVAGNPAQALDRPLTVMLSEKSAMKYFNTTDVVGKRMKGGRILDLEVTGVYKNFPAQSHWHPEFLIAFSSLYDSTLYGRRQLETNYGNNSFSTYLLLEEGADPSKLEAQFPAFIDKHYGTYARANYGAPEDFVASKTTALSLQRVDDIHLRSHLDDEIEVNGNINNVYMMGVIGFFIVLIACFNFINLSTARATKRAKEVGMRKVVGAIKSQLINQYLSESVLIAFFALAIALVLAWIALPWLNEFTGKQMALDLISNWSVLFGVIAFAVVVGILAGLYPAFVISGYRPAAVLKGQQGSMKSKGGIRKILVVSQFSISIVLMIATAITVQQLNYLNNRDLGYNKDQVITLRNYSELNESYDAFANELLRSSAIKSVARSSRLPTGRLLDSQGEVSVMKGDSLVGTGVGLKYVAVDHEFFKTYDIQMAAGRAFSKNIPSDDSLAFVINEAAARKIGWATNEEAIDQDFLYGGTRGKLIGIVKDFHFESLHQEITPMVFFISRFGYGNLSVKVDGGNFQAGVEALSKIWKEFLPIRPFDYQFVSDRYRLLYEQDQKQSQLFTIFSGMAIFIACLGLFGLATFNTMQRVKEIGIRKVMGASVPSILVLLSKEIVILIVIANLIAWPTAWYFMDKWLNSFAYHIDINAFVFILSAIAAIVISLLTVSAQTMRAAMTNPSSTLRYE
jgi:putative ABC transport system permease protein